VKSTPQCRPGHKSAASATADSAAEPASARRPWRRNDHAPGTGTRPSSGGISSRFSRRPRTHPSITTRISVMAVNIEIRMPSVIVTAKPRIAPAPRVNSYDQSVSGMH